jgi:lipopolysaccharide export LptBFGC system permease protein LptF
MRTKSGPIILILIGVIFLLVNRGLLPVAELKTFLAQWWPLILIIAGVWALIRRR